MHPEKESSVKIESKKPPDKELETQGVLSWFIWEKEISRFDRHYDSSYLVFFGH